MVTPGKAPNGCLVLTSTTYLPSALTLSTGNNAVPTWKLLDSRWKFQQYTTSSAVNSPKPFCHFTPSRSLMRQVSGSGLDHSSASIGSMGPLAKVISTQLQKQL